MREAAVHTIERTITVPTSLERVWGYMADFANTEEWDPPTRSTDKTAAQMESCLRGLGAASASRRDA